MTEDDRMGFIDGVTDDRLEVLGWVRVDEGARPKVRAVRGTDVIGTADLGSERQDVLRATGITNRAIRIRLEHPVSAVELLGGGVRLLTKFEGHEFALPLSNGARRSETLVALDELSQDAKATVTPMVASGPSAGSGSSHAADHDSAGNPAV